MHSIFEQFERGSPHKHSFEVWLTSVHWFRGRCGLKLKIPFTPFLMPPGSYLVLKSMFCSVLLEQIMYSVTKGTFLLNYLEIRQKLE